MIRHSVGLLKMNLIAWSLVGERHCLASEQMELVSVFGGMMLLLLAGPAVVDVGRVEELLMGCTDR